MRSIVRDIECDITCVDVVVPSDAQASAEDYIRSRSKSHGRVAGDGESTAIRP